MQHCRNLCSRHPSIQGGLLQLQAAPDTWFPTTSQHLLLQVVMHAEQLLHLRFQCCREVSLAAGGLSTAHAVRCALGSNYLPHRCLSLGGWEACVGVQGSRGCVLWVLLKASRAACMPWSAIWRALGPIACTVEAGKLVRSP